MKAAVMAKHPIKGSNLRDTGQSIYFGYTSASAE